MGKIEYQPIGIFHCPQKQPVDSPRQGSLAKESFGYIELNQEISQESLRFLEGFERIWILYDFNQNESWKPLVRPPRGSDEKRGVFATRSPYRPNSIGMSCVKLLEVSGRRIKCGEHDLLDQTPILDIKPYVVLADCFPEAKQGWLEDLKKFDVQFSESAQAQIRWIESKIGKPLRQVIEQQLSVEPCNPAIKRVKTSGEGFLFHYRTWKFFFELDQDRVVVLQVSSNYTQEDLIREDDPYGDKAVHRNFLAHFS